MTIREQLEAREYETLSVYAQKAAESAGRLRTEDMCEYRTAYQRDRDRIVHAKAFRRLMHKTQVFLSPEADHYRTRLTHTLEVMQIARTAARALFLNEDLCEAIALGHDLGHTPFGHAGEAVLKQCYSPDFTHAAQSLRVVDVLERDGMGLNLTHEVRDGILQHTGTNLACTAEGRIVKFADRIAYINHDIDDAVRAGVLTEQEIPSSLREILGETHKKRIDTMVSSLIRASAGSPEIRMEADVGEAMLALRAFLFERVYLNPDAKQDEDKAMAMLSELYAYFLRNPDKMPQEFLPAADDGEPVERHVCDYIAGMTDRYAIRVYSDIHIPKKFRGFTTTAPEID
ncbi:MAG: deoxyguanosinetriphosphate triphosphohydrolase [Ruminococcaceae bacterium]|nr:deoxyguanosinetriphosphate triphosphohydrolase [Oscillospiraceae bacterium]